MKKKSQLTAKNANRYDLYEESVQNVEFEVEFISDTYKKYNKSKRINYLTIPKNASGQALLHRKVKPALELTKPSLRQLVVRKSKNRPEACQNCFSSSSCAKQKQTQI